MVNETGDMAMAGGSQVSRKVVNFKVTENGDFVDDRGNAIEKSFVLTMYKMNDKGVIVDDKGKPVESVNVVVEEEPGEDYTSDSEENSQSSESDPDGLMRTLPCEEEQAQEIALNKAMERMLREFGEEAISVENIWQIFLNLLEEENFTKAFEVLLRFGDDFYFLRGCILTGGKIIPRLHKRVAQRVIRKLCQIRLAGNLDTLSLHFIERGVKNNYLDRVDFDTNMSTLKGLEKIASHFNNAVKDKAEYLHSLVTKLMALN